VVGGLAAYALFGGWGAALAGAVLAAVAPLSWYRGRRQRRLEAASEAWPRLLEELRLLTGAAGRSIPQAVFEVGRRAPEEWRTAFAAAEREWLLTTDFAATTALLKERLADPTADAVCETLLVAQEVGGSGLEGRLEELIEDRRADVQGRKDASSRLAGVRFARRFVLLVPLGMTLAGLSIGAGRQAYETAGGQVAVALGLIAVAVCWVWSGRLMRVPEQPRVFR
jgi:tight adherence protein B